MEQFGALNSTPQSTSSVSGSVDEEMNVYLKIVKTKPMRIKGTDTIGILKAIINQKEGITEMNQKLFFNGKLLSNAQTIAGCGIHNYATLQLFANDYPVTKISIKMPSNNRIITLEAKASETVHNIKLMIQEKEGILSNSFTLVCNGNLLEDERTLASTGIGNNSTIHLVFCEKEVLTIFVEAQGMEAVKLSVKVMFTVGDVKAIVMSMIDERFINNMSLYYAGEMLDDSKTLAFYDIKEGSGLHLLTTAMQIFVKTWNGKTVTLYVQEQHKVNEIIAKAFQKLRSRIPANVHISLVYAGKRLEGEKDLASYRIRRDSTLQLVLTTSYLSSERLN